MTPTGNLRRCVNDSAQTLRPPDGHRPVGSGPVAAPALPVGPIVKAAYDAAIAGDVDQLVTMFAPSMEWRGATRGHLWWRRTPS